MKEWKKQCSMLAVAVLLMMPLLSSAQSESAASAPATEQTEVPNNQVEMADVMRQNGKIYVVVAVILLIFSGLIAYLFRIDRKVSHLEKELS